MIIHLIGGILNTACGKDLEVTKYTNSKSEITCKHCKSTKLYKNKPE